MKKINRNNLPKDFLYYRSSDKAFIACVEHLNNGNIHLIQLSNYETGWIKKFFHGKFALARFEKVDTEPTIEAIQATGVKHGIIFWTPWRTTETPMGWKKLPKPIAKNLIESTRMGWSEILSEDFYKDWKGSARWTHKKALQLIDDKVINIQEVDATTWGESYKKSPKKFTNRPIYEQVQQYISKNYRKSLRHYLAYVQGEPLAGILLLDQNTGNNKITTTTYLAAFLEEKGKPYCLGTALIDRAMTDSYKKGIKYFNFDHFRDEGQIASFQGFTDFKEKIAQYDTNFHDMWIRWF
ncbi:MAG: hypothetical protein U0518_05440 [Candidatus Gracilibacteria bacterium]